MHTRQKAGKVLGELESEVMEIVWQSKEPVFVRTVTRSLQKKRPIAYTTVMTIMNRLVDKGLLHRQSEGRAYQYQHALSKDKFLTRISHQIIKNFISSFGDVAIAHFVSELEKIPVKKKTKLIKMLKGLNE